MRTKADEIIRWLTGYSQAEINKILKGKSMDNSREVAASVAFRDAALLFCCIYPGKGSLMHPVLHKEPAPKKSPL